MNTQKQSAAARRARVKELANLPSRQVAERLGLSLQTLRSDLNALGLPWIKDHEAHSKSLRERNAGERRKAAMRGLEKARAASPLDKPVPPPPTIVPMATLHACRRMIGNGDRIEHVLEAMNLHIEPQRLRRLINNLR